MYSLKPAVLVLENGTVYHGEAFGAETDAVFELVFNTSMTGYQEICTDPSYRGQGVLFTVPHIGNVGVNLEDIEARVPQVSALVVRSISHGYSNWRADEELSTWLARYNVPGISGVDTRAITRVLRQVGTLKAAISTRGASEEELLAMARNWPGLDGRDMVTEVTCPEPFTWTGDLADRWITQSAHQDGAHQDGAKTLYHVVLFDFGAKRNILRHLSARGAKVTVVPAHTTAEQVFALKPDGVMLSNGPGDPAGLPYAAETVRKIIERGIPVFGICLGHQLIAMALGGKTARLKFGHHSGNHPVQDMRTKKVYVTAQNHNYRVVPESLTAADSEYESEITHISLNDGSVEGLRLLHKPVYSVQFHPEAAPGPHDAHDLFAPFFTLMESVSEDVTRQAA